MQIPKRRSQMLQKREEQDNYITADKLERMKRDVYELEKLQRPKVVEDLAFAREQGDLSENAEYQDAKAKLGRIDGRLFSMKERIKNAVVIEQGMNSAGTVQIGSTVTLSGSGKEKTYQIVGSQESNPSRGMISRHSPLGSALLNHTAGETVVIQAGDNLIEYVIIEVK
ncbi:MAG: transcription elongation factor GreA [Patescibacteria group bacterium]